MRIKSKNRVVTKFVFERRDRDGKAEHKMDRRGRPRKCQGVPEGGGHIADQIPAFVYRQTKAVAWYFVVRSARYWQIVSGQGGRHRGQQLDIFFNQLRRSLV